jgi:hypothetical protein
MKQELFTDQGTVIQADDRIHDTAEITEIYLQRPQSCLNQSLGIWFCNAHGLRDGDMKLSASSLLTKKYLWMRGYTKFPLGPLLKYNARMAKPGRE